VFRTLASTLPFVDTVHVPEVETVHVPVTEMPVPAAVVTFVTVPALLQAGVEAPIVRTWPLVPAASACHPVPPAARYRTDPVPDPITSKIALGAVAVGCCDTPDTLAKSVPSAIASRPIVPVVVIGPPVTPLFVATLVTVPVPDTVVQLGFAAAPFVVRTWPDVPGLKTVQAPDPRYRSCPCVLPSMSSTFEAESAEGTAVPPELLPRTELFEIDGSCARVAAPAMSAKVGWLAVNAPAVESERSHWLAVALIAFTHPSVANPEAGHCVGASVPEISENAG